MDMYFEYSPDIRLSHLIETYWVSDTMVSFASTRRILPDGCVDIIFSFTNNDGAGRLLPFMPYIVGTMTSFLDVSYDTGMVQMLGIRFRPNGITAFTKIPVSELTDKSIELALTETLFDSSFYERLSGFQTMKERIFSIEIYLISRLPNYFIPEKRIDYVVECIRKANGLITVRQIAAAACLSERQLERKFKSVIGISPKIFSRIIKFRYTVDYLRCSPKDSLYMAALECGYFDHSHLIKDFREFGGVLPNGLM